VSTPFATWDPATYNNPYYYAAFVIAVGAIALSWLIRGSRFGLQLLAIRDDEDRARGLGVRAMRVKLTAFVISAFVTGIVGGLWVVFIGQALPETAFNPAYDLSVALMGFLGGFGTLWGPVLGALLLEPLQQEITQRFTSGYESLIVLGGLFLLVILFLPRGLIPTGKEWADGLRAWWERRGQPRPGDGLAVPGTAGARAAGRPVAPAGRAGRRGRPGPGRRAMTALLRVEGVCKAFGGVQALSECVMEVEQGSIAGLIGPNGSGKTTLFNVITGYERIDQGEVYLKGGKITNLPPDK